MKRVSLVLTLAVAAGFSVQAASAQTLKTIKDRGLLSCGVTQGIAGFSLPDDKGNWTGLDVDICRAISAAIFNDPSKVKFVPLSAKDRFTALQSGEIDVLSRTTTWTLSRDTSLGANFTGVTYYDGQGFLVRKAQNVSSAHKLAALLRAGMVYVNAWSVGDPAAPFGGYKASGIGREFGREGLEEYLELKSIVAPPGS